MPIQLDQPEHAAHVDHLAELRKSLHFAKGWTEVIEQHLVPLLEAAGGAAASRIAKASAGVILPPWVEDIILELIGRHGASAQQQATNWTPGPAGPIEAAALAARQAAADPTRQAGPGEYPPGSDTSSQPDQAATEAGNGLLS